MTDLIIGDTHAPFMHRDAIPFLSAVADKYDPGRVIHIGDVADFHALSRFVKNPAGRSAGDEADLAAEQLAPLYKLFTKVSVCTGNHDRRLENRAEEAGIPKKMIIDVNTVLRGPAGWQWADSWTYDDVVYEHGDPFSGANAHIKAAVANMGNTVIGHVHAHAGINYVANRKHLIFGFNVGCLIDKDKYAFHYAKKANAKPIIACGIITDGVPMLIPMSLKPNGRWDGRL